MARSPLQRRYLVPQRKVPLRWKGVRDVGDDGLQDPEYLQDAINVWFPDASRGGAVYARPGFALDTSSQLGQTNLREVQCIIDIQLNTNPFFHVFAVVGGKVYRRTPSTGWTDVTPTGITINTSQPVYAVAYQDALVFSDGTNEPWVGTDLTSTPITGTEIEIDTAGSAWTAFGAPTVHGGKVFFRAQSIGSTSYLTRLVWSEEGDATLGYQQDGYTNFWDIIQTGGDVITAILGTNAGLVYFRTNSIGLIRGSVNADFQTSSTHDGISHNIGTIASRAVLLANGYVWFLSYDGRPFRFPLGSTVLEPLWEQFRHRFTKLGTLNTAIAINAQHASMAYIADLNKVVLAAYPETGALPQPTRNLYVFDADTGSYEGRWIIGLTSQPASETPTVVETGRSAGCIAAAFDVRGDDGVGRRVLYVGGTDDDGSTGGHIWRQHRYTKQTFGDDSNAMHMSVTSMLAPNDQTTEFRVDEIDVSALPDNATMSLDYYTPRASSVGQLTMTGLGSSDLIQSSHDHGRYVAGLNALGRWFRAVLHWNVPSGSTQYAFQRATLKVRGFPASPRAK